MKTLRWLATSAALAAAGNKALACAACFGRSDSPLAKGMNYGILSLLAIVAVMLGLVASFFVFIVRRQSRIEAGEPPAPNS